MKKTITLCAIFLVTIFLSCWVAEAAFVTPTEEEIEAVAKDPGLLGKIIKDSNEDQAVETVLKVIEAVDNLGLNNKAARARVGALLDEITKIKGAAAGDIIARIIKKVNPRLLPVIFLGGSIPLPPPPAPKYPRQ